jgi:acyl-CoA hydrolase
MFCSVFYISELLKPTKVYGEEGKKMSKLITCEEAVKKVKSGSRIMVGGFGLVGSPLSLIAALAKLEVKDLGK